MSAAVSRALGALAVLAIIVSGHVAFFPALAHAADDGPLGEPGPVLVVLDVSGSMADTLPAAEGESAKLDHAKSAILDLIPIVASEDRDFGLMSYPGGKNDHEGCPAGTTHLPVAPLDPLGASATVRGMSANGNTPTGPALNRALAMLEATGEGRGTIVLVSDGESNCGGDPCEVAKDIVASGFDVRINTVGFDIDDAGWAEMTCIADAANGTAVRVQDAALGEAVQGSAGATLELHVEAPSIAPVIQGTGRGGGTMVTATLRNTAPNAAADVRLTLDVTDAKGTPGSMLVVQPTFYLGNLEPGITRTVTFELRPDTSAVVSPEHRWRVRGWGTNTKVAEQDGTFSVTDQHDQVGPLLADVRHVVVLGDSYSSGEGTGDYAEGTDGGDGNNECHRSENAYGHALFADDVDVTMIACSGATTADFYAQDESGDQLVSPQLLQLRTLAVGPESPDAVLLSIGGNDAKFGLMVATCFASLKWERPCGTSSAHYDGFVADPDRSIQWRDFVRTYRDIDRAVNDGKALEARGGKIAPIIVVPYPDVLPAVGSAVDGCAAGITEAESRVLQSFQNAVNATVESAVGKLASEGRPVFYAADVVDAFQPDHTVCEGAASYVVRPDPDNLRTAAQQFAARDHVEWFHPNARGHVAMAAAIAAWSRTAGGLGDVGPATDWSAKTVQPLNWMQDVATGYMNATDADIYEVGGTAVIDADGFAPSSTIVIHIRSLPTLIGSATADADGSVRTQIWMRGDLEPGRHTIVVSGIDANGDPVDHETSVYVLPEYGGLTVIVFVQALLTALTCLALIAFARRRRAQPAD